MFRHSKHYFRVFLILVLGLAVFLLVRAFLIPKSFGEFGFYRGSNVEEQMNLPTKFAAKESCAGCHAEIWETKQNGPHATVGCQNCHAPLSEHVNSETGEFIGPMPIRKESKLCLRCHLKLASRPKTQPQIDLEDHLAAIPPPHSKEICLECHIPHDPLKGKDGKRWKIRKK